ncbi:MAG: threonine synthase [Bacillota bacterium]
MGKIVKYISTRGNYKKVNSARAIQLGMVPEGGLFLPEEVPAFSEKDIFNMQKKEYNKIAFMILNKFLSDYSSQELEEMIDSTYNQKNFNNQDITPLKKLNDKTYIMELWHGPTAAFKDMALQLMPQLLVTAKNRLKIKDDIVILVATSGDTGTAALEGFKDIEGINMIVFYPENGVSKVQEKQMTTTEGENVAVVGIKGNFDDCQNAVKEAFGDRSLNTILKENGYRFSSANSINWGRLVPQIIYYFVAYADLLKKREIMFGEKINLCVPTGNFGNILAGYYAFRMGLPVNNFICASNENKVLTDFLKTGVYDINRDFKKTISPSMDILVSSNLERFLYEMNGNDPEKINNWFNDLKEKGKFEIDVSTRNKINNIFIGKYATEKETRKTITKTFEKYTYTIDPHTAVGVKAYEKCDKKELDGLLTVINSTASPYKFGRAVLKALTGKVDIEDEFEILGKIKKITGREIHPGLKNLEKKETKHKRTCDKDKVREEIKDILNIM